MFSALALQNEAGEDRAKGKEGITAWAQEISDQRLQLSARLLDSHSRTALVSWRKCGREAVKL